MKKKDILLALIALLIGAVLINALIPFFIGSTLPLIVLSGSMSPLMLPGDMVVAESINPAELRTGDIITFQDPGGKPNTLITHRIISIKEGKERVFKTKGDANKEEDNFFVPASNVVGKLTFVIPFAGYLPEFSREKNLFYLTVILPAALIILDEIKTIVSYSNPARARKIEHEKKKASRRTFYKIKGKKLAGIVLIGLLIPVILVQPNIGDSGNSMLETENTVENSGSLPSVLVVIPEDPQQRYSIEPWYMVISPYNSTQITTHEQMPATISSVPYILPVFWIIALAEVNPYLPAVAELVIYTSIFTLLLFPLWCRKVVHGEHKSKKKASFRRSIRQWRRVLRLA